MATNNPPLSDQDRYLGQFRMLDEIIRHALELPLWDDDERTTLREQAEELRDQTLEYYRVSHKGYTPIPLNVAVIGDFSAGKSTFINSLLGHADFCPVSVKPTTSCITRFHYGPEIAIYHQQHGEKTLIEHAQYHALVQEAQVDAETQTFEIHYPSPWLDGIVLIDTPGFNNPKNKLDTQITLTEIQQADIIILVMDAAKGNIGADMLKTLNQFKKENPEQPIFAIANKIDQQPPSTRQEILNQLAKTTIINESTGYSARNELKQLSPKAMPLMEWFQPSSAQHLQEGARYQITRQGDSLALLHMSPAPSAEKTTIQRWFREIGDKKQQFHMARNRSEMEAFHKSNEQHIKTIYEGLKGCHDYCAACNEILEEYASQTDKLLDFLEKNKHVTEDVFYERYYNNLWLKKIEGSGVIWDDYDLTYRPSTIATEIGTKVYKDIKQLYFPERIIQWLSHNDFNNEIQTILKLHDAITEIIAAQQRLLSLDPITKRCSSDTFAESKRREWASKGASKQWRLFSRLFDDALNAVASVDPVSMQTKNHLDEHFGSTGERILNNLKIDANRYLGINLEA